jgi:4-hydroxy-tetrahydrodipicolinate synthase
MTSPQFGRLLTAMVTPFASDGSIDHDVATQVAKFLVSEGSDGLVIAGSTGEGTSLSDKEKLELFKTVANAVTVPVIAGSTSSDTARSVDLTAKVKATGVAGILATTPAYARPSQRGIELHLEAVAQSTTLPVMLYDIPSRTGRKIESETSISLVQNNKNIVALKDASADLDQARKTKSALGDSFDLYSGDDSLVLDFMSIGGVGVVSVASHWASPEFSQMINSFVSGDLGTAGRIKELLVGSCSFEGTLQYPNPMPSKAAMRYLGFNVGQCRLPHAPSDAALDTKAVEIVTALRAARG